MRPTLGLPLQTGEYAIVNQTNVGKMLISVWTEDAHQTVVPQGNARRSRSRRRGEQFKLCFGGAPSRTRRNSRVTDLARLGLTVIGFMVAMIGVWITLSGRDGWY